MSDYTRTVKARPGVPRFEMAMQVGSTSGVAAGHIVSVVVGTERRLELATNTGTTYGIVAERPDISIDTVITTSGSYKDVTAYGIGGGGEYYTRIAPGGAATSASVGTKLIAASGYPGMLAPIILASGHVTDVALAQYQNLKFALAENLTSANSGYVTIKRVIML